MHMVGKTDIAISSWHLLEPITRGILPSILSLLHLLSSCHHCLAIMARSREQQQQQQQQILILTLVLLCAKGALSASAVYYPAGSAQYQFMDVNAAASAGRRELSPFQLCLQCQCCAANDASNCAVFPCCFGIACNLPDKPYGVCAFVPKSCNCTSCD